MQQNKEYTILDLFNDTDKFNHIAGAYNDLSRESFNNQLKIIQEEYEEFVEGHNTKDLVETVDGLVDALITLFGYQRKMQERYNIDFSAIMQKIAENNLSKFLPGDSSALVSETLASYLDKGQHVISEYNSEYDVFVIRDAVTKKVKKPINFVPVDITKEVLG